MKSVAAAARDAITIAQVLHDLGQFAPLVQKLEWITEDNMPMLQCMPRVVNMICEQGMVLLSFLRKVDVYIQLQKDAGDMQESELPESMKQIFDATLQKLTLYAEELLTKLTRAVKDAWNQKTHENDAPLCVHTKELISLLIWAKALWL